MMDWPLDPFSVKKYSKVHPLRLAYTAYARSKEFVARAMFQRYALPDRPLEGVTSETSPGEDTAVTAYQAAHLLACLRETEHLIGTAIVEVGAYRGVITEMLARNTKRKVYAVDPYIGYGGTSPDREAMVNRTRGLQNVVPVRATSGEAVREWNAEGLSLVFIDAVHDYVNTRFDSRSWGRLLVPGGLLAFHDVDNKAFAGTRKAAFECLQEGFTLHTHVYDLAVFRKSV